MPAKKSKSRFTDLVKFVPEEVEEAPIQTRKNANGIQTNVLNQTYEKKVYEEPVKTNTFVEPDDIPEIEPVELSEEDFEPETYEEFNDESIDVPEYVDEETEEIEEEVEESVEDEDFDDELDTRNLAQEIDIEDTDEVETTMEEEEMAQPFEQKSNKNIKDIDETIIIGNTTIKGDIITDTGIQIYGAVLGNIESGGRVQLVGKVEGNIAGKSVYVSNTKQTGNIDAETDVYIKEGCHIEGDVTAERVFLRGSVNGNIHATGQVEFEAGSEIQGNVTAHSFNIKPGARINGSISTD